MSFGEVNKYNDHEGIVSVTQRWSYQEQIETTSYRFERVTLPFCSIYVESERKRDNKIWEDQNQKVMKNN